MQIRQEGRDAVLLQSESWRARAFCRAWLLIGVLMTSWARVASAQFTYDEFPATPDTGASSRPTTARIDARVTVVLVDSTIKFVVDEIAKQAHLQAFYTTSPQLTKRVTVRLVNMRAMDALNTALKGTGLGAVLATDGETVIISPRSGSLPAGHGSRIDGVITGLVIDSASGKGLSGVTIRVEGMKLSTVSSDNGRFMLKGVPPGDHVLSIKRFGYRSAQRMITVVDGEPITIRIMLSVVPTVLSGVVTTAAGQQQRYKVGNDITVLNADSIQNIAPVSNLTQMLATRVPGLVVQNTSGIPGAPSRLRLRGISSVNASSDPILIVDGIRIYADQSGSQAVGSGVSTGGGNFLASSQVQRAGLAKPLPYAGPSALDQIDPNSIETIEVLKGPSATAIYGSDAATGVIIITTKRGRPGPTHWALTLNQDRTTLPSEWPLNWYRFGTTSGAPPFYTLCLADGAAPITDLSHCSDSLVAFQALDNPRYSPLTGNPGQNTGASLTVSGGSGALTYSVTGSAANQTGYLHLPSIEVERFQAFHGFSAPNWMRTPDTYATYSARSNVTVQLGQHGTSVSLASSLLHSAQQQSSLQNDLGALSTMYVDETQLTAQPLFSDYYTRVRFGNLTFNNALTLSNWAPWHWLFLNVTAGLNASSNENSSILPRDYVSCLGNTYDTQCGTDSLGQYTLGQGTNTESTLNISTILGQGRLVSTAVGINVVSTAQSSFSAQTTGLPLGVTVPNVFVYQDGSGPSYNTASTATYGWYVQPTLDLNQRCFVSPGFRLDGGSSSGAHGGIAGSGVSGFPKIDFSCLVVNRPPSNPVFGILTSLRPRIAFGIAGIQPAPGDQLRLLQPDQAAPTTATGAGTPVDLLVINTLGNAKLIPERDQELEGGMDLALGDQRVTLTLTGYHKMAYDAILQVPVAPSVDGSGWTQARNVGTIRNTGVEATGAVRLLDRRAVALLLNASLNKNENRVVSLVSGQPPVVVQSGDGYQTRLTPGYPLFGFWAPPIASYVDANHDGVIEANEVRVADSAVYVGAPLANYELTMNPTLTLFNGHFSINTSVVYQNGLTQIDQAASIASLVFNPRASLAQQAAAVASLSRSSVSGNASETAIGFIQTVNTLRWNTLSINWIVPAEISHHLHLPAVSLALQGSNLGLRTNYKGADPDVNAFSSGNLTADTGQLPPPRVWSLRVSLVN